MWYAIYDVGTGRLLSLTSVQPPALPVGAAIVSLGTTFPGDTQMWDEATRSFVPRVGGAPVDRLDDIDTAVQFSEVRAALAGITNSAQRQAVIQALRTCIARLLGGQRWRDISEGPTLG